MRARHSRRRDCETYVALGEAPSRPVALFIQCRHCEPSTRWRAQGRRSFGSGGTNLSTLALKFQLSRADRSDIMLRTLLLILVILLLIGALPTWPYSAGWGYYPSGGAGLVLIIVIVLVVVGAL
jgi:hypothetical protein